MTTYDAPGFSCEFGGLIFSNFSYTDTTTGGAVAVPASGVVVETMGPVGAEVYSPDFGLAFSGGWSAPPDGGNDALLGFTVSDETGAPADITDAAIAQIAGGVSGGLITLAEQGCSPAPCLPTTWSIFTLNSSATIQLASDTMVARTGDLEVYKDLDVSGLASGFAGESLFGDTFSQTSTPEPASFMLIGFVLCVIGAIMLRRNKGRSNLS